jgi:hypothetical protein
MRSYRYRIKEVLLENPLHTIIILCGYRSSEKWRRHLRHTMLNCELAYRRDSREQFEQSYEQAMFTLAFMLKCISTDALVQRPVVGAAWRWMIARIDWQAIATRQMLDATFELCLFGDLP